MRINVFISDGAGGGGGGGGGLSLHISHICIFPRYLPPCAVFTLSRAVAGNFPPLLHSCGVDFPSTTVEPLHQEEPSPLWDAFTPLPRPPHPAPVSFRQTFSKALDPHQSRPLRVAPPPAASSSDSDALFTTGLLYAYSAPRRESAAAETLGKLAGNEREERKSGAGLDYLAAGKVTLRFGGHVDASSPASASFPPLENQSLLVFRSDSSTSINCTWFHSGASPSRPAPSRTRTCPPLPGINQCTLSQMSTRV